MTPRSHTTPRDSTDGETETAGDDPQVRVECYVRTATPSSSVTETLDRLERLSADGHVAGLDVTAWPAAVDLTDRFADTDVVHTFDRFRAWADQWNVTVCPPFAVEERTADLAGRDRRVLVTPALCLAVYAEGALAGVFPHTGDDGTVRVTDAVDAIAAGDVVANGDDRVPADPPAEREACPVCGSGLTNGQGLYHCSDCDRTVVATPGGQYASSPAPETDRERTDPPAPPAE